MHGLSSYIDRKIVGLPVGVVRGQIDDTALVFAASHHLRTKESIDHDLREGVNVCHSNKLLISGLVDLTFARIVLFNSIDYYGNIVSFLFSACLLLDRLTKAFILLPGSLIFKVESESWSRAIFCAEGVKVGLRLSLINKD